MTPELNDAVAIIIGYILILLTCAAIVSMSDLEEAEKEARRRATLEAESALLDFEESLDDPRYGVYVTPVDRDRERSRDVG